MPEKEIAPLLHLYYITDYGAKQPENGDIRREKRTETAFSMGWSDLLVKFLEQKGKKRMQSKQKPHPGRTTDAAG